MANGRFYIVILRTFISIDDVITNGGINPNSLYDVAKLKALEFLNYEDAWNFYQKIIQPLELNNSDSNYWNYILLNEIGFKEFIELRENQKFNLQNLKNKEDEKIDLTKLEIQRKEPFGGGVIKGKKNDFKATFNFWVNSVTKTFKEEFECFYTTANTVINNLENILNFFNNRNTNANAESFNAKIKLFRANLRGVVDTSFFLFRLSKLFA